MFHVQCIKAQPKQNRKSLRIYVQTLRYRSLHLHNRLGCHAIDQFMTVPMREKLSSWLLFQSLRQCEINCSPIHHTCLVPAVPVADIGDRLAVVVEPESHSPFLVQPQLKLRIEAPRCRKCPHESLGAFVYSLCSECRCSWLGCGCSLSSTFERHAFSSGCPYMQLSDAHELS